MDDQTKKLLKECNVGCKMALQSMTQVEDYLEDSELERAVEDYRREHERVEKETSRLLMEAGVSEKDPSPVASASSWITTEMRLMMKGDCHQVAKLMMNGCYMGIQSIAKCQNECRKFFHIFCPPLFCFRYIKMGFFPYQARVVAL